MAADDAGEYEIESRRSLHFMGHENKLSSVYGWQRLRNGPKRLWHTAVVFKHQMIVFGGYNDRQVT